jgi:hypothetical protein
MDRKQKLLCKQLAKMESEQAADWLMNMYPTESTDWGDALLLIPHRSWQRADQKRLARYYFNKLPFASQRGYEAFSSFMSIKTILECIKERLPMDVCNMNLLLYYSISVLNKTAKNDLDRQLISKFIKESTDGLVPSNIQS